MYNIIYYISQSIVADVYLNNHKLEQLSEFPYSSSRMITSNGEDTREIKRLMGMAKTAFSKKS